MSTIVNFENVFEMPLDIQRLEDFRHWTHSETFPETGRIDFVLGRIEVDMSPEDLFTHGTVKITIAGSLFELERTRRQGHLFVDSTRVVSLDANLSAEPDIVFVSHQSVVAEQVRFVPKASGEPGRYVEIEGAPDLIVEIVSDSSRKKDTERLPRAYFEAGVPEFWLVDVRGKQVEFRIHSRGKSAYQESAADAEGYSRSEVFNLGFRLDRSKSEDDYWQYELVVQGEKESKV